MGDEREAVSSTDDMLDLRKLVHALVDKIRAQDDTIEDLKTMVKHLQSHIEFQGSLQQDHSESAKSVIPQVSTLQKSKETQMKLCTSERLIRPGYMLDAE